MSKKRKRESSEAERDRLSMEMELDSVSRIKPGPNCSMCAVNHVDNVGDICTECKDTWCGPDT